MSRRSVANMQRSYRDLQRVFCQHGLQRAAYQEMEWLRTAIIRRRRRRRPLLWLVTRLAWFVQFRINRPLVRRISQRASQRIWWRVIDPIVNEWALAIRARDAERVEPAGYQGPAPCGMCGRDARVRGSGGVCVIGNGYRLTCGPCGRAAFLGGLLGRNVQ